MESESSQPEAPAISLELVGPPPRRIQLTGNGITLAVATAVIVAAAIIFTCFIAAEGARQAQIRTALRGVGNETIGKIEKLHKPYALKEYVDYTFTADGKTYLGKAIVPLDAYHKIKSASSLSIRYLPENPALNHPVDWEWSVISEWDPIFTIILVAGLGCLVFLVPRMRFERRLAAEGIAAFGMVTKCSVSGRRGEFINLKYDFRTQDGTLVQGGGDFKTRREVGSRILILYIPQNPAQSVLYPLSAWRIVKG
jgi:hypothetical protein